MTDIHFFIFIYGIIKKQVLQKRKYFYTVAIFVNT